MDFEIIKEEVYDRVYNSLIFSGCENCGEKDCEYRDDCDEDCIPLLIHTIKTNFTDDDISLIKKVMTKIGRVSIDTGLLSFQKPLIELSVIDYEYNRD